MFSVTVSARGTGELNQTPQATIMAGAPLITAQPMPIGQPSMFSQPQFFPVHAAHGTPYASFPVSTDYLLTCPSDCLQFALCFIYYILDVANRQL